MRTSEVNHFIAMISKSKGVSFSSDVTERTNEAKCPGESQRPSSDVIHSSRQNNAASIPGTSGLSQMSFGSVAQVTPQYVSAPPPGFGPMSYQTRPSFTSPNSGMSSAVADSRILNQMSMGMQQIGTVNGIPQMGIVHHGMHLQMHNPHNISYVPHPNSMRMEVTGGGGYRHPYPQQQQQAVRQHFVPNLNMPYPQGMFQIPQRPLQSRQPTSLVHHAYQQQAYPINSMQILQPQINYQVSAPSPVMYHGEQAHSVVQNPSAPPPGFYPGPAGH
jgi:hypothetical protein